MTKIQIIAAIRLATGKSVEQVAKEHGYSKPTFYRVINNETNSPEVQLIISTIINKPVSEIWPADDGNDQTIKEAA